MSFLNNISDFYNRVLFESPLGSEARGYLESRGFTDESLFLFSVGFSPPVNIDYIQIKALKYSDIAGLLDVKHLFSNEKYYSDRFKGRITFPLIDTNGKVLGFAARSINGDLPKYLNSAESTVYSKSRCLFGLNIAAEHIFNSNYAILCEGYTDAIAFHQSGKPQAVACGGTYATAAQLSLIGRYTRNIILAFDADDAGDSVTSKTAQLASNMGFKIRYLEMERGKDPAEVLLQ